MVCQKYFLRILQGKGALKIPSELIILKGIESKEFVNLRPNNAQTSALSLILNFEGIFWFNIFSSKYVDAEKYIDEVSSYILYVYTQKEGEK